MSDPDPDPLDRRPAFDDYDDVIAGSDRDSAADSDHFVNGGFATQEMEKIENEGKQRYSLQIPVEETALSIHEDDDPDDYDNENNASGLGVEKETMFFIRSSHKRVDYVLAFEDTTDEDKISRRQAYEANLKEEGLELEFHDKSESVDGKSYFTLVHATWEALVTGAELMNMQKRILMPENSTSLEEELHGCCDDCCNPFTVGEPVIPDSEEQDYFTASFSKALIKTFDINWDDKEAFFTNAERSLIVKEILDRTPYTGPNDGHIKFGIHRLMRSNVYKAAYPLHEGPYNIDKEDKNQDPWIGSDKDRQRLYESWAKPKRFPFYQPLDLIRKYFGEKVGIYFAWLGYYTTMLIPASILGTAAFIYGCVTVLWYPPSNDICDQDGMGNITMCPQCDKFCEYWKLNESCIYARITYIFDNYATVAFAAFMSLWSTVFLEFWKRKQKEIEYDWDVANFELEERLRPEFEMKVRKFKTNPITQAAEPYVPWYQSYPRQACSFSIVLFFMLLVVAAILGVIVYRIVIVQPIYSASTNATVAKLTTTITASLINLIIIMLLNLLYKKIAWILTEMERPRTDTEFEDSYTFKMYLFQFVNFYGSIFYIAFFKGRFTDIPGIKRNYLFGEYRQDACDPSGCLVDLFIQLAIIMVGKQTINNGKELLVPFLKVFCAVRKNVKKETSINLYMRWEQDLDLTPQDQLGLFEEYLEMVIQYGFVTIFVAAFPLAPLFALINNVIEIRLDAYKYICVWRRASAIKAQDIGVWMGILQSISFMAILSNAFIIGWTSDFIPKLYYMMKVSSNQNLVGYLNDSLSYFDINDYENDTKPNHPGPYTPDKFCRFKGYYQDPWSASGIKYDYTKEYWNIFAARLAFVIVFEHSIFLLTWIISALIPDAPASVKQLQLYERALNRRTKFDHAFGGDKLRSIVDTINFTT